MSMSHGFVGLSQGTFQVTHSLSESPDFSYSFGESGDVSIDSFVVSQGTFQVTHLVSQGTFQVTHSRSESLDVL